jgi:hypothetical protein
MLQSSMSQNASHGNVGMFLFIKTPMTIARHIEVIMQNAPTENITLVRRKMDRFNWAFRRIIIGNTMTKTLVVRYVWKNGNTQHTQEISKDIGDDDE